MAKKMLIDATHAEETRVVVVDGNRVEEFDFDSSTRTQITGNIYLAKVTRVEPSLQAAFVDYGGNRHGFLAFSEIHPDYYQIPQADREALLAEEAARAARDNDDDAIDDEDSVEDAPKSKKSRTRRGKSSKSSSKSETTASDSSGEKDETKTDESEAAVPDAADKSADAPSDTSSDDNADDSVGTPKKPARKSRAKAKSTKTEGEAAIIAEETVAPDAASEDATSEETAPKPKRKTSTRKSTRKTTKKDDEANVEDVNAAGADTEQTEDAPKKTRKPRKKAVKAEDVTTDEAKTETTVTETTEETPPAPKKRAPRRKKAVDGDDDSKTIAAANDSDDVLKSELIDDENVTSGDDINSAAETQPQADEANGEDTTATKATAESANAETVSEDKPKRKSRTRKKKVESDAESAVAESSAATKSDDAPQSAEISTDSPEDSTKPSRTRARKSKSSKQRESKSVDELFSDPRDTDDESDEGDSFGIADDSEDTAPKSKSRRRSRKSNSRKTKDDEAVDTADENPDVEIIETAEDVVEETLKKRRQAPLRRYKIQEVIKVRQIMLVQVLKEERGNKGAAVTTYLSLPGRYCVLMPNTARGGGISRKIANPSDRKRLKSIANDLNVPKGAGLIVRTAGARQDKSEIERDYDFLLRQWNQIRELTLSSVAPAPIYAESGPIKRAIRDLITKDINEILVEGESAYQEAQNYMQILMPERVKDVKLYNDSMPLFSRYQVESFLSGMFNPVVQLKSGGYIVFGVTEALVSVDVNSGRSTKEASIEHTALKTNLEAAEEIARQLKLRDLAGLIVIDFIDMEQRRHHMDVENRLKDSLRSDRARIQVGRISSFGLLEMSRQRLRSGLVEMITQPCPHCHGTGITRADDNMALSVLRAIEEEIYRGKCAEINVRVPVGVANYLFNDKRDHLTTLEMRSGIVIKVEGDNNLLNPQFEIDKRKDATRTPLRVAEPITVEQLIESEPAPTAKPETDGEPKKKRSRGGRRRNRKSQDAENLNTEADTSNDTASDKDKTNVEVTDAVIVEASTEDTPSEAQVLNDDASINVVNDDVTAIADIETEITVEATEVTEEVVVVVADEAEDVIEAESEIAPQADAPDVVEEAPSAPPKPKRKGWWNR